MKRILHTVLAVIALVGLAGPAHASILTSSVIVGAPSSLQDNSASVVFDSTGNPIDPSTVAGFNHVIGVGDVIVGSLRINQGTTGSTTASGINTPNQLVILFSAQIAGRENDGNRWIYNLAPTATPTLTLNALLGGLGTGSATSQFSTTNPLLFGPNSIFAVLESVNAATNTTQNLGANIADYQNGAKYKLDLSGGLAVGTNASGSTDFFQAQLERNVFGGPSPPTLGAIFDFANGADNIFGTSDDNLATAIGADTGVFSVLINQSGIAFGTVNQADNGFGGGPLFNSQTHTGTVAFDARLLTPKDTGEVSLGYSFADDTAVKVFVTSITPEPASIAMLTVGLLCVGGSALRMRRRTQGA